MHGDKSKSKNWRADSYILNYFFQAKPAAAKKEDKKEEDKPQVELKPSTEAPNVQPTGAT